MIIAVLIVLGLCFGSFVNALVWRIYQQSLPTKKRKASKEELSVTKGRSMCVHCGHTLSAIDLLPVVSWVALRGKCRYCHKTISWQYPLVELVTAGLFVGSYLFWPSELAGFEYISFASWLVALVIFMALVVYDFRWMLLPNKLVFTLYGVAAVFVLTHAVAEGSVQIIVESLIGVAIGGGIFYALFQLSDGRWIGGGDVKLGFALGAVVGGPIQAFLVLFGASLLGTLAILPLMFVGKPLRSMKIPFGPFLIAATVLVQLFGQSVTDWYIHSLIL